MSAFNDAAHVEHAARSILAQDLRELELIVVDDGSIDGTGELLDRLAATDARMRVLHQENTGLTLALIRSCSEARGEFIARQDSDDWSHPRRIAEQVALLDSDPRIGFVSCATEVVGPDDEHLTIVRRPADPEAATRGLLSERQGPPAHGSVMFRRSLYDIVGGYRPEFHFAQDSDLWLRMAERSRIGYLQEVRFTTRKDVISTSGVWRPVQKRFGELSHLCRQARNCGESERPFLDEARELAQSVVARKALGTADDGNAVADAAYLLGAQLVRNGDARARGYLWQAIRSRPTHLRAWVRLVQSLATTSGGR